jgi:hypothetical protein
MKYRMHILIGVFLAMLGYVVANWLLGDVLLGPLQQRRRKTVALRKQIERERGKLKQALEDKKQLALWRSQSLPSDPEVARWLYRGWLLELVDHVGLSQPSVVSDEPVSRQGLYRALSFAVRGRGTLEQLTKFLFEFYRADHLHQIRSLGITPVVRTGQLELSISIEALALPGADRKDQLSSNTSDRLVSDHLADYQVIVHRNLFGAGGSPDMVDQTYLTSVTYVNGHAEAWFDLRTDGKIVKVRKGDKLEVGPFRGTVAEIEDGDVILESDRQRWLLTIGESLSEASALPPEF